MCKDELKKTYLDSTYSVVIDENKYDIKIGESIAEDINKLLAKESSAVILTACNPRSQMLSSDENKNRNNQLYLSLKNNNYIVFNALGQGNDLSWSAEESFFILGIKKEDAEQLAVEYKQYAYVWIEYDKLVSLEFSAIWYE